MKYIFIILISLFLTGCITLHETNFDYPSDEEMQHISKTSKIMDISFSVIAGGEFMPELSDVAEEIKNDISSYNIFRKVLYTDNKNKTKNHISFYFYIRDFERGLSGWEFTTRFLSGLTFYILPATQDFYIDSIISLYTNGNLVYSISAPQKFVRLFWLPALLTYPYYNQFVMRKQVFKKSVKYFLSEIVKNHLID